MKNGNGNGWRWHKIAQRVARDFGAQLGPTAFGVYYSLVMTADNDTGHCFPAKTNIAKSWGLSRRTVDTAMSTLLAHRPRLLEAARWRGQGGRFSSNEYRLLDPFAEGAELAEDAGAAVGDVAREPVKAPQEPAAGAAAAEDVGAVASESEPVKAPQELSASSSVGKLNTGLVSAQILRVVHAQNSTSPRANSAHGDASPRAKFARGDDLQEPKREPFAAWDQVVEMLRNIMPWAERENLRGAYDAGDCIEVTVEPGVAGYYGGRWGGRIANVAQRVTGVYRPVVVVAANGHGAA